MTSYLKLVADNRVFSPKSSFLTYYKKPEQYELPHIDYNMLGMANISDFSSSQVRELIQSFAPKWIVDTRIVPRLDIIGGSRSYAFKMFNQYGAEYFDLFGYMGLNTYRSVDANPELWGEKMASYIKKSHKPCGPYLVFFDNQSLLESSKNCLATQLKSNLGQAVSMKIF